MADIFGRIYGLYDPRDGALRYIGQTVRTLKVRLQAHNNPHNLKDSRHVTRWLLILRKFELSPEIRQLGEAYSREELDQLEVRLIQEAREHGASLTNIVKGGGGRSGYRLSPEARLEIRVKMTGHVVSAEARSKISKANKGRPSKLRGYKHSQETVLKYIECHKGIYPTLDTRRKMSESHKGLSSGSKHHNYRHDLSTDYILDRLSTGSSRVQVADELGISVRLVSRRVELARRFGNPLAPAPKRGRVTTDQILDLLKSKTQEQVARELGISRSLIILRLRERRVNG
jgi:DNA-binding CsgD family transcriptional regulator